MHGRWLISRTNTDFLRYLSKAAAISPVLAQILVNRGLKSVAGIRDFLGPGLSSLEDPFVLPGMGAAVERVRAALRGGERVLIHGDYDADGLTATAIMLHTLRKIGLDAHPFVPNRMLHGYGFGAAAVDLAGKMGARLILTVDCGITSFDAVSRAAASGIDVIITDHHEPSTGLPQGANGVPLDGFWVPDAAAVVNPKLSDTTTPLSVLSGAGVAFKLAQALSMQSDLPFDDADCVSLLDLAAVGTLADIVPVTRENRIILTEGLRVFQSPERPGFRLLKDVAGIGGRDVTAGRLAFTLVPRLNAPGRMADASDVVRLLLTEDPAEAEALSRWVDNLNSERQKTEEAVCQAARAKVNEKGADSVVVLANAGWHQGVLGIVASRISEEYNRPAVLLSIEDGVARGSARSIPCLDIHQALEGCRDLLLRFGGHKQAAGLTLSAADIPAFEDRLRSIVRETVSEEDMAPVLEIDAAVTLPDVTFGLIEELGMLEPFGYGNPEPMLGAKGLQVVSPRIVGNNHLKMRLRQHSSSLDAIGFDMGRHLEQLTSLSSVDAAFMPALNEWNGGRYLQLTLKALRQSP